MESTWRQQMGVVPAAPQSQPEETGMVDVRAMAASITRALEEKKRRPLDLTFGGEAASHFQNPALGGLILPPRRVGFFQKTWVLVALAFFGSLVTTGFVLLLVLSDIFSPEAPPAAAALPPLAAVERPAPLQEEASRALAPAPLEEEASQVAPAPEEAAPQKAAPAKKSQSKKANAQKARPAPAPKPASTKKKNTREADELLRLLN